MEGSRQALVLPKQPLAPNQTAVMMDSQFFIGVLLYTIGNFHSTTMLLHTQVRLLNFEYQSINKSVSSLSPISPESVNAAHATLYTSF